MNDIILFNNSINKEVNDIDKVLKKNNIVLSRDKIYSLVIEKNNILKDNGIYEVNSILSDLIYKFSDSLYLDDDNYYIELSNLINIYYYYRSNIKRSVSDEDIIDYLRYNYDNTVYGNSILLYDKLCMFEVYYE